MNENLANMDLEEGKCACDSLSQVSEESAFEEEDYEQVGTGGTGEEKKGFNVPKFYVKKYQDDKNGLNKTGCPEGACVEDDSKKKKQVTIKILASMPNNAKEEE